MNNLRSTVAAVALAAATNVSSQPHQEGCTPESQGYQQNLISRTCAKVLEVSRPLQFELKYTKAAIAGTEKDIGQLQVNQIDTIVAQIYQEAMRQVNDIIEDKKAGLIQSPITTVNIRGTITAGASPDVNISSKTLKRTQGDSPAIALFRETEENKITAQQRCKDVMTKIPTLLSNQKISVQGLHCEPQVHTLDLSLWSEKLLKLSVDIEKIKHSQSIDDAMILGVIMANKKTEILPGLSPESLQTITELSKQFETMRTMHLQGTLTMSVLVNETEFQWSRIVGGIGGALLLALLYGRIQRTRGRRYA